MQFRTPRYKKKKLVLLFIYLKLKSSNLLSSDGGIESQSSAVRFVCEILDLSLLVFRERERERGIGNLEETKTNSKICDYRFADLGIQSKRKKSLQHFSSIPSPFSVSFPPWLAKSSNPPKNPHLLLFLLLRR